MASSALLVSLVPGGSTAALLGLTQYRTGADSTITAAGTAFADFDATNLKVDFTVPSSGKVLVRLSATGDNNGAFNSFWAVRDGTTAIGSQLMSFVHATPLACTAAIVVSGLTPGVAKTYKWAGSIATGGTAVRLYSGPTWGPCTMEVWSA